MIVRGLDGTFYEIPDDKTEEYKIPPAAVKEKLDAAYGSALPNRLLKNSFLGDS